MQNKLNETEEYFITQLANHFKKQEFSIEEAKNYIVNDARFSEKDFSECWQKCFTLEEDNNYISKGLVNKKNFILKYKALKYIPLPRPKDPWTHSEIIAVCSAGVSVIVALIGIIF